MSGQQQIAYSDLCQQVVTLTDQVSTLVARLATVEAAPQARTDFGYKRDTFDKKMFEPEKLEKLANFKEWAEDFIDYVDMCDESLGDLLRASRDAQQEVTRMGADDETIKKSRALYRILKRNVIQADARAIIAHVNDKNVYEAWRQLFVRYDPRNDASSNAIVTRLMNVKLWKCNKIQDIPVIVAKWEGLQREHRTRTGEEALNVASKRELLKLMIPEDIRRFIEIQTVFRKDLTYENLKAVLMDLVQRTNSDIPIPMETNTFAPASQKYLDQTAAWGEGSWAWKPQSSQAAMGNGESIDSFGKGAKGAGVGKGEGKGGKGKGGKETRTCHNCNKAGHIARDCWSKGKPKGKGKGKGAKERGNDGKWYRKGVNSWELEEDQQDGEGEWTAEEQPEAGVYAFSATGGLGGGLAEEDDGYHSLHALEDENSDTQSAHACAKVASSSES